MFARSVLVVPAIIAVAVLVRLVFLLLAPRIGMAPPISGDAHGYMATASSLLAGEGFAAGDGNPTAFHGPIYPLFLAGVFAVFGMDPNSVGIVQAALGGITAGLVASTAWRLAGPLAGWVAGLIVAFYPHLIMWTHFVLSETLFILFAMLALWLLVEGESRSQWQWFAWAGVALALGALTRTALLPFIPVAAATAWWLASRQERWLRAGLVLLAPIMLLTLWIIRNALVLGVPTLSTQGPMAIWWGNQPDLSSFNRGGYAGEPQLLHTPPGATEVEVADIYWQEVRSYLATDPLLVVRNVPVRVSNMWRPVWDGFKVQTALAFGGSYVVVLVLGTAGFLLTLINPPHRGVRYVQGYIISLALLHALLIGEIRFRMPIEPALAILAGITVANLVTLLPQFGKASSWLPRREPAGRSPSPS